MIKCGDARTVERSYHKQWVVPLWPAPPLSSKIQMHPACQPKRETEEKITKKQAATHWQEHETQPSSLLFQQRK